jgi:hypothetical protein
LPLSPEKKSKSILFNSNWIIFSNYLYCAMYCDSVFCICVTRWT